MRWIRHSEQNVQFAGQLRMVRCTACDLIYLNPRPAAEALRSIYNFDRYADSTNANAVLMEYFLAVIQWGKSGSARNC